MAIQTLENRNQQLAVERKKLIGTKSSCSIEYIETVEHCTGKLWGSLDDSYEIYRVAGRGIILAKTPTAFSFSEESKDNAITLEKLLYQNMPKKVSREKITDYLIQEMLDRIERKTTVNYAQFAYPQIQLPGCTTSMILESL